MIVSGHIDTAISGPVAVVTVNRPEKLNALDLDLMEGLEHAFLNIGRDRSVRCAILTGAVAVPIVFALITRLESLLGHRALREAA